MSAKLHLVPTNVSRQRSAFMAQPPELNARRYEAQGFFQAYKDHAALTTARFLNQPEEHTPVFVRFFSGAAEAFCSDTVRDVRGFDVRFFTTAGTYDLLGNSLPAFAAPDEATSARTLALRDHWRATAVDAFWSCVAAEPQSMHMLLWQMSDRTLPRSLRMMEGFGIKTFVLRNARNRPVFCRFHWRPLLGNASLLPDEAKTIAAADPNFHRRDLVQSIHRGEGPQYELLAQILDVDTASKLAVDVLDPLSPLPDEAVEPTALGVMTLNRAAQEELGEERPLRFAHTNLVPGIELAGESVLAEVSKGDKARQYWLSLTSIEQAHLTRALATELQECISLSTRQRVVDHLVSVSNTLAIRVAQRVGAHAPAQLIVDRRATPVLGSLSLIKKPVWGLKGRHVGILLADGFSRLSLRAVERALAAEEATVSTVSAYEPRTVTDARGEASEANHTLAQMPSALFDVVVVLTGKTGAAALASNDLANAWVADAFAHLKVIAYSPAAKPMVERVSGNDSMGLVELRKSDVASFVSVARQGRVFEREAHFAAAAAAQ